MVRLLDWKSLTGGQEIEADAPLDRIPLFVRAGSILPMGPQIEYATQDPCGAHRASHLSRCRWKFDLYEDAGDGYEYEKGQHSIIPIRWDDRSSSLTIGSRQGSFPGMIEHRKFRVVLVAGGHGTGVDVTSMANAEIGYEGKEVHATIK